MKMRNALATIFLALLLLAAGDSARAQTPACSYNFAAIQNLINQDIVSGVAGGIVAPTLNSLMTIQNNCYLNVENYNPSALAGLSIAPNTTGGFATWPVSGGGSSITIGSTVVSGTAGLLYGSGGVVQSFPGTFTAASGLAGNLMTFANDYTLALQTVGDINTPLLKLSVTTSTYNYGNMAEFYAVASSINYLDTYIAGNGAIYTSTYLVASGHTSGGPGFGRQMLLPNTNIPSMFAAWSDVTGPSYVARDNAGTAGEYSFMGLNSSGVTTLALDAANTQIVLGNQTVGASQIFTGDTFLSRAAAANWRYGGADAAAPVAQTISVQNVLAGTSNTAGANTTIKASAGTGTGTGGSILFNVAPAGTTGTSQNSFSTALTIAPTIVTLGAVTSTANAPQLVMAPASGNAWGISSYFYGGGNLVFSANNSGTSGSWSNEMAMNGQIFELQNVGGVCYSSTSNPTSGTDLCLWRGSAGAALLGNGTLGDYSGSLKLTSLLIANATSGAITLAAPAGALGSVTATIPDNTGTVAELNLAQSWSAVQTFATGDISLTGATTGCATFTGTVLSSTGTACGGSITFPQTVAGTTTSGGIPYFSSTTVLTSSGLLSANAIMVGGGAGVAPSTVTTGTGVITALGIAVNNASGFPLVNSTVPTVGHCLQWGSTGIADAGGSCTTGGGGGTVSSGNTGQLAYYASTGTTVSGATTGTGILTALGVNVGTAGSVVVNGGALGTPSSGTLTNATGLPISTGVSGLGANIATALGSALNGTGAISATTSPTFVTPVLGTPTSVTLTNGTGLPISTGVSGLGTSVATALGVNVGSAGAFVVNGGALGTPSSGTLTNATGLPINTGVSGLGTGGATALAFAPNAIGGFLTTPSSICTSGQYLTFLTASSVPTCGTPAGAGTVTSVATGFGLTGGPITTTGTASYDPTQVGWSYRNRVVNSGMLIDQVNVGAAYTLAAASALTNYTLDQWYAYESAAGTGLTGAQLSVKTGGVNYAMRIQRAAASTTATTTALLQPIESNNMIDLQGQAVTLSFRARVGANWSGSTPTVAIITGTTADQGAASLAAGTWAGQTTCGSATPTLTTSFAFYVVTCTVASGALEIAPKISWAWSGTAGAADSIDITDVELVPGTYTAAQIVPERHLIRRDLADCQRYFAKSYDLATAPGTASSDASSLDVYVGPTADASSYLEVIATLPVPMRADPTITLYNPHVANTTAQAYMSNAATSPAAATSSVSQRQLGIYLNGASVIARDTAEFHYTANARL